MPSKKPPSPSVRSSNAVPVSPELALAQRNLSYETQRRTELEQKLLLAETQIEAQRKEITVLHHELGSNRSAPTKTAESRARASPAPVAQSADMAALQKENEELKKVVRKQMLLIDTLKRQKILSEAATVLTLTEREYAHDLELDRT